MSNNLNRVTIFENGDYSLHATLKPVSSPVGGHSFVITSQKRQSRNPNEEQVRFLACLDRNGLAKLNQLLQDNLDP